MGDSTLLTVATGMGSYRDFSTALTVAHMVIPGKSNAVLFN